MENLDVNSKENNKFKALELCLFIVLVDIKSDEVWVVYLHVVGSIPVLGSEI